MNPPSIHSRPRNGFRVLIAGAVLLGIASNPAMATPRDDADRAAIEALAGEILGRIDAAEALRAKREEANRAVERAKAALEDAEKSREIAEIAISEYLKGTFPQEVQTIHAEIKLAESELARAKDRLAWAEKMAKRGSISESGLLADRMSSQKSEISLLNAKKKLELLQDYTKLKETTLLEASRKKALAEELERKAEYTRLSSELLKLNRLRADASLSDVESRALIRLDEAIALLDQGKAEPARAKLVEAQSLWRDEQARRAKVRFDEMKSRLHRAAEKVKPSAK